jgi:hypothetical protein
VLAESTALIFFIFWPNKIHVRPTSIVSSLSPLRCCLSSSRCQYAAATPYHASFLLSQDKLAASTSSSGNTLSRRLPSQAQTEALDPHHCRRLPLNHPTLTLSCYKKIISTLATLPVTQSHFYFASSLERAPRHQSFTCRCRPLSSVSHIHRPSAQRYPQ